MDTTAQVSTNGFLFFALGTVLVLRLKLSLEREQELHAKL
jgi:hypothetical protein